MKYKIAICDDSDADREYVLNMVNRWAAGLRLYLGGLRGSCTPLSDEACQGRKTLFCP